MEDQMRVMKNSSQLRVKFKRGGKLQGNGANTASKIVGARGSRVRIPRTADSFKSRTDNT
jgi:hypothetical protein